MAESKSTFEIIVDLIKAMIWPILVVLMFILFYDQIFSIIEIIPSKIRQSSRIKIGDISLEIERYAKAKGNEELAVIIQDLSKDAITTLVNLGKRGHRVIISDDFKHTYTLPLELKYFKELEKKELLSANEKIKDYENYFLSLNVNKKIVYKENYGSSEEYDERSVKHNFKYQRLFVQYDQLSAEQVKRLIDCSVKLTKKGLVAFEIIVEVISGIVNENNE